MPEPEGNKKVRLIRTPDQRLRVFISSTLKELAAERDAVRQAVLKLHLAPVMFEAGARPYPARELYQAYLAQSQIFIGIYWQSYGWVGPGMEISGLEDEYNLSAGLSRLLYVKSPAPELDSGLEKMLKRIQAENTVSYKRFSSTAELAELVENDLALLLSESYEIASRGTEQVLRPGPLTNIPFPRNPLLGRDQELATVCEWLNLKEVGLVTLTGTGGTGKSRLALEAALRMRDHFADGVYLVQLTPVREAERVIPTIAKTLGLREGLHGEPVEDMLFDTLRDKHMLLLLDNFEQVLEAAPKLSELVEACPGLQLLVTSRAPLHVRAEKELVLQPLTIPTRADASDPGRLSQYAAVRLFIQRAQAVQPDFQVRNENAPAVAEICARLEGLPLAIELAAARIRLLRPEELLKRLSHRFELLRGGTRDLPERQQTLHGTIAWSYELLTRRAQALLRKLSVFAGGWSLEAAEAVCKMDDDPEASVLDEMQALVDMNLVIPMPGLEDQQRFGMLESIREYAYERLMESDEMRRVHERHAQYFLQFVQDVEPRIRTTERLRWREVLEQDLENIRSVIRQGLENEASRNVGRQLTIELEYFWPFCGYMTEGLQYIARFTALMDDGTPPGTRANLLCLSAAYGLVDTGKGTSMRVLEEATRYAREAGDKSILANCLQWSGLEAMATGDPTAAEEKLRESLALLREMGDNWNAVLVLLWLSEVQLTRGNEELAMRTLDESVALARERGDPSMQVPPLADVAQAALAKGNLQAAESILNEIQAITRPVGDHWSLAWAVNAMAQIHMMQDEVATAVTRIMEAMELARTSGNKPVIALALVETACIVVRCHPKTGDNGGQRTLEFAKAARLCSAAQTLVSDTQVTRGLWMRETYDQMVQQVRTEVEDQIWERACPEGAAMPLDRALDMALAELKAV